MRNPAELSLARPRVVVLATLLAGLYGALGWLGLPRQENPPIQERYALIDVYLPGAEPAKVERLITRVLEEKVAEVEDVHHIFASSAPGSSFVQVELHEDAPIGRRMQQVREKVQEARERFPPGASDPEVNTELFHTATLVLALVGDVDPRLLRREARALQHEIERLPDVRKASLLGLPREEIEVAADLHQLSRRGVSIAALVDALASRGADLPGGELELGSTRSSVTTAGVYESAEHVAQTVLRAGEGGHATRVGDVASVRRQLAEPEVLLRYGGERGVSIAIEMLGQRNVVAFGQRLVAWAQARERTLPAGLRLEIVADEAEHVAGRLAGLTRSLLLGMALVTLLTLIGLGWRVGTIVALSIPLSVLVALGLLDVVGIPLHQISIAALVIGMGLVVDEAIVVSDNIRRKLGEGLSPRRAAIEGLGEIHLAVLAGVATTIAAFLPLYMMEGDVGAFVQSIPVVVTLMLLASAGVAHFVTPLCMAYVHEWAGAPGSASSAHEPERPRAFHAWLAWGLDHRAVLFGGFGLGLVASLAAIVTILSPPVFFSKADRPEFLIDVALPGGARLERTDAVMARMGERLRSDARIESFVSYAGSSPPKIFYNEFPTPRAENLGAFIVRTAPDFSVLRNGELVRDLNALFKREIPGARVLVRELEQGYGVSADISIYLTGDGLDTLRALSSRIVEIARSTPGVLEAGDSFGYDSLTLEASVHDARARALGIGHDEVAATLRAALDGVVATTLPEDDEEIEIVVRASAAQRRSAEDLESLPVYSPAAGRGVPLAQLASLAPSFSTGRIHRWARQRESAIRVDVEDRNVVEVTNEIEAAVRSQLPLPPGYAIAFEGQRQEIADSFLSLAKAAVVAVLLIYMILVLRFHSLLQPVLIVLAIPMGLMGSVLGLVVTGNPLGFTAFLGFIALTGIVVNDSIVLVDTINRLRATSLDLRAAVEAGTRMRVRAVVLTSLTTMGGLLPLALTGGSFWAPFGFAMIFGLGASTLLTLFVQPAAYLTLESRLERRERTAAAGRSTPTAATP